MRMSSRGEKSGKDEWITGDVYRQLGRIETYYERFRISGGDILIVLDDAEINFSGWNWDCVKKKFQNSLLITLFYIHGNHVQRHRL